MASLGVLLLGLMVVLVLFAYFALVEKIVRWNANEAKEAKRMLGGFKNLWAGRMKAAPHELGDYRATRGLSVNFKNGKIRLQSTPSPESYRAIFSE